MQGDQLGQWSGPGMEKATLLIRGNGKEQTGEICKVPLRSIDSAGS